MSSQGEDVYRMGKKGYVMRAFKDSMQQGMQGRRLKIGSGTMCYDSAFTRRYQTRIFENRREDDIPKHQDWRAYT